MWRAEPPSPHTFEYKRQRRLESASNIETYSLCPNRVHVYDLYGIGVLWYVNGMKNIHFQNQPLFLYFIIFLWSACGTDRIDNNTIICLLPLLHTSSVIVCPYAVTGFIFQAKYTFFFFLPCFMFPIYSLGLVQNDLKHNILHI